MQRYFHNKKDDIITLNDVISKHIIKVMRNKIGEEILLCIDKEYYIYTIVEITNEVIVKYTSNYEVNNESSIKVTHFIPILKKDNHKVALQKAIELGCEEVVLYQGDNSVVKWKDPSKKISQLEQFVYDSCRQSFRNKIISISFKQLEEINIEKYDAIYFGDETKRSISNIQFPKKIGFITGCEGGFSSKEYTFFKNNKIIPISLSKTILRAETAPIAFQAQIITKC